MGIAIRVAGHLPMQFRVLYRQFLLRVVDLEALSVQADVPRLLGQFAGVLILIGGFRTIGFLWLVGQPHLPRAALENGAMQVQLSFLAGTMLIVGLVAVVSWDGVFPDRRDAMVLGALPVRPAMILAAKLAASDALLATAVVSLNFGIGVMVPLVLGGGLLGFLQRLFAMWFTLAAVTVFLYGAVLTVQGFAALALPRRVFLRVSGLLQLTAFALFLTAWIYQPGFPNAGAMITEGSLAGRWPACWFLCLDGELSGTLRPELAWMAHRAWIVLGLSVAGAGTSLLLCYFRTMKKTVEEPDLLPGSRGLRIPMRWGDSLQTAIVQFSIRSLVRSKQHRVVYAFFLAITFAIAVSTIGDVVHGGVGRPLTPDFIMPTLVMICLAIVGLRSIFSLPVSLKANWVLQVTQLRPPEKYIAAGRRALLVMSAGPVWLVAAALSLWLRPWIAVSEHLLVLAPIAAILIEICMLKVSKVPFACSYLPGKSNIQYVFWAFVVVFLPVAMELANEEMRAFRTGWHMVVLLVVLGSAAAGLRRWNRRAARSAILYYEEQEPEVIVTLGLSGMILQKLESGSAAGPRGSDPIE